MAKISLLFTVFIISALNVLGQTFSIEHNQPINPIIFARTNKSFLLITDTAIFRLEKQVWRQVAKLPEPVNTAIFDNNTLWLAGSTLFSWDESKNKCVAIQNIKPANILSLQSNPKKEEIFVSTANDGAFSIKNDTVSRSFMAHTRIEDACSCGDYTWMGTSMGLARLDALGNIQMYVEEGVGGFEIPDNLVSRLICLGDDHLLVTMSEGALAFLDVAKNNVSSHAEGFDFLGKKGNTIFDVLYTLDGDLFFLTQDGMILMKKKELLEHHEHSASIEVHSNAGKPTISKVKNTMLLTQTWKKGYFDKNDNLWLSSNSSVLRLSRKEWRQLTK